VALSVNTHPVLGDIVTDSDGLTLYIFSNDTPGVSNCSGGCLSAWPPVLAALGATGGDITGDLGVITREDGDVQVTLNDLPLYYYRDDTTAGDANGQALGNVWWVVGADGVANDMAPVALAVNTHPVLGDIVTDSDGLTLYIFSNDTPGVSNCSGGCLSAWPPVLAALGATGGDITGDLGVITREDSDVQVTLNDLPLYYYRDDTTAGDANGQALGNVWWVVGADGASIDTPLVT
jgi:predicted lipoprotein with Yx(FWY)xxD motif